MPRRPHTSPQTLRLFDALLADAARWRYGYDLSRETGLASGTLYPLLMRLADQQLLETGWEPSDEPGRPPRHTYRLTSDGAALARQRLAAAAERAPAARRLGPAAPGGAAFGLARFRAALTGGADGGRAGEVVA
ncbi:PadR family transcriptional regulator [Spirilliplanes yamanashiensis]|uniref:Transcription regulator PadR N-terminal domain-containing protein n=1 Tax=Spirilliplanes yamanashiensis TaxID=42233 RepID=A0A8J3Y965_9ACTN|nr:PadR family transcriptional regulator [Spirilliplanes yamanashiensis]MDP9815332.1 hypothetical protein [Spirilliplanes yamanashiensis]GIJ03587.1 hypothetical protein Sya03_29390 [Spirilliplanes yamanashiensis]